MAYVINDMPSSQQQHSSDSMQNNNGDNRSLMSTGVGAQEKFVPITVLLEMGASRLGVLVCGSVVLMLVQGGIFVTMETKDRVSVTVLFFLVCFRCWRYFYPQNTGSLTEATQSLSADNIQQLAVPIGFISRLFYGWNLVSVMTCVVLSMMRLASQDFGQTEVANKGPRDFALNVFYGLTFAEALVLFFSLTFITIMAVQRKVTEALIEWVKPSQPAQAQATHQNSTQFVAVKRLVYSKSVGYSHLPESELHDLFDFLHEFSLLKPLLLSDKLFDFIPEFNFSTLKSNHLYFDLECLPCFDLRNPLSWMAYGFLKERNKLIHPPSERVPQVLNSFRTINLRNLKYIHPSLERGLCRRVSRPPQLLLKEDCSDDSEGNLPHLKAV